MAQGKTNTSVNGHDYYRLRVTVGYKMVDGKKKQVIKNFNGKNKTDAEAKYKKWLTEQAKVESAKRPEATFGSLADFYAENVLAVNTKYSEGTRTLYGSVYRNYVKPDVELMSHMLIDIDQMDIQLFFNRLTCSPATIKSIGKFMRLLFKWLSSGGYCADLMAGVIIPKQEQKTAKHEIVTWGDESLKILMDWSADHRLRLLLVMALGTGLRSAELRALTYSDIYDGAVHVDKQYQHGKITPPKSRASYRTIPLHPFIVAELEKQKKQHEMEMRSRHYKTDYIFTSNTGKLLDPSDVRRSLERLYAKISEAEPEFEPKHFHAFRATFCTNLRKAGVRLETAAALMGHSSTDVTTQFYSAVSGTDMIGAVTLLPMYSADDMPKS